ncbi:CerR family C-terminal domain-containing protein [Cupriavidus basilensis]|uniref:CerR family C-terminal domain-containing protein n=1 Tax=Cupriavidus basilensis TaxID=68895 RepID=UPI003463AE8F
MATNPMARHRPAAEGGYQRGEETRLRIVEAALRLFGERGFEGASTRDIAKEAGVNAPALQYYFDNKEGVYIACVEHFVARVWESLAAPVSAAQATLANPDADDSDLIDAYLGLQGCFVSFLSDSPEARDWQLFMARERAGLGPPAAFAVIDERLNRRLFPVTASIIGRLTGRKPTDDVTKIRTIAIDSQVAVFRMFRRNVLGALGWEAIGPKEMAQLADVIFEQTRVLLLAFVAARDARQGTPRD